MILSEQEGVIHGYDFMIIIESIKHPVNICSKFWISINFTFTDVFMENLDDLKENELLIKKILNLNERWDKEN